MKLSKKKLGVLVAAALGMGVAGQASADVYAVGSLQLSNLVISSIPIGTVNSFTFTTFSEAFLNGAPDPTNGGATCSGFSLGDQSDCGSATPILSGLVQNAPGSGPQRAENDTTTTFGTSGQYSNAESQVIDAALLVIPGRLTTATGQIAESNLKTGTSASANTDVQSQTSLSFNFTSGDNGSFSVAFDAAIKVLAELTGGDVGGAQGNTAATFDLFNNSTGIKVLSWAPDGVAGTEAPCAAGFTCITSEAFNLNQTRSTSGAANGQTASGSFRLDITGLTAGDYSVALRNASSTQLSRRVPVPGTLFLMGAGLLAIARGARRQKKV